MEELVIEFEVGDVAATLVDSTQLAIAEVICRESAVLCGTAWVEACYRQIDSSIVCEWLFKDGDRIDADHVCLRLKGPTKSILIGEQSALAWLKTLSAIATQARAYANQLKSSQCVLLAAQQTIPGLRAASHYAVRCGGGDNHPVNTCDSIYIQKNHMVACGTVSAAIKKAKQLHPDKLVEVEVETLNELAAAIKASADRVMLNNFSIRDVQQAVTMTPEKVKLEVSGDFGLDELKDLANTGIDFISLAALTTHCRAIDYAMRLVSVETAEKSACR